MAVTAREDNASSTGKNPVTWTPDRVGRGFTQGTRPYQPNDVSKINGDGLTAAATIYAARFRPMAR